MRGKIQNLSIKEKFIVCQIREDTILGIPFLVEHRCVMRFGSPTIEVEGQKLACTDRQGHALQSGVRVMHGVMIPPGRDYPEVAGRLTEFSVTKTGGRNQSTSPDSH